MRALSPELISQLYSQESYDPFLMLITLSHTTFLDDFRIVNNSKDIISNGKTFMAFPFKMTLPVEDGETSPTIKLTIDNVGLELVSELRSISDQVSVKIEMILASIPNDIQMAIYDMKLNNVSFTDTQISGTLYLDDFLNTRLNVESYGPSYYRAIF